MVQVFDAVLVKAIFLIRMHGWRQRAFGNERDGFCVVGALNRAHEQTGFRTGVLGLLQELVGGGKVAEWNDAPGRTAVDVIALLERARQELPRWVDS